MVDVSDIIKALKDTEWETKSRPEIEAFRLTIAAFKLTPPGVIATQLLKEVLREQLVGSAGHAKDELAVRLFNHYLDKGGAQFNLLMKDIKLMNSSKLPVPGPIDIRKKTYASPAINPEWTTKLSIAKRMKRPQMFSGSLLWAWDNGAIANYTVKYDGLVSVSKAGVVVWSGDVEFQDRFDLDPRWEWSPSTPGGRSRNGERRTRIGYMLNLGTDFPIRGPKAKATQKASDKHLVFSGAITAPASGASAGNLAF